MTETQGTRGQADVRSADPDATTGWVGWVLFAGMMLLLVGTFQFIAGLVALFDDGYYLVSKNQLVVHASYTTWGWAHMILGVLAIAAGYGVMVGKTWARVYAIAVAFIAAVANLAFVSAYPVWAILFIAIDILVIFAIAVHGSELRDQPA